MINRRHLPGWLQKAGLVMLAFLVASCGDDSSSPPTTGSIQVTASTTGDDIDSDGYVVSVDGGADQAITVNGSVTFSNLAPGARQVELAGVAANCTVAGDNPRAVNVTAGQTTPTTFQVTCTAIPQTGEIDVTTSTTGDDLDADGYTVTVDGGAGQPIGVNETVTIDGLDPGDYDLELTNVASNCTVGGDNPRTVAVTAGGTATTTFDVACTSTTGTLKVVNVTTGTNPDDAYTVTVDGGAGQALAANDSLTVSDLAPADYSVELTDVAANCTVAGDNPRTVSVAAAAEARTQFDVTCAQGSLEITTETWGLGVDSDGFEIAIDGGTPQAIGNNDATTLDLAPGDYSLELSGLDANCNVVDDVNPRTETVADADTTTSAFRVFCFQAVPADFIMFETNRDGDRELYGKDDAAATAQNFTRNAAADGMPSIAPDGSQVAFESNRAGNFDIWVMNAAGVTQLTTASANEFDPSWAGDNSLIAYVRSQEIWRMNTGGGNQAQLSSAIGSNDQPSVSPDGDWVLFRSDRDGNQNVYVVRVSDRAEFQLTSDGGIDGKATWWADGSKVIWVSDRSGNFEIWVADFVCAVPATCSPTLDIANATNISNNSASDLMPDMREDAVKVAFVTNRNGSNDIWTMNADGQIQREFEASTADDVEPSYR